MVKPLVYIANRCAMPVLVNQKHEAFAHLVASGKSQISAYAGAGYEPSTTAASRLANYPHVAARIKELQQRAARRTTITQAQILEEMAKLAFWNVADYIRLNEDGSAVVDLSQLDRDQAAAITKIRSRTTKSGTVTEVEFADKRAALTELGRHFGLWTDKVEIGKAGDFSGVHSTDDLIAKVTAELGAADAKALLAIVHGKSVELDLTPAEHAPATSQGDTSEHMTSDT